MGNTNKLITEKYIDRIADTYQHNFFHRAQPFFSSPWPILFF